MAVILFGDWLATGEAVVLLALLLLATAGTAALFLVAVLATRRRRSEPYLLLTVAVGLLVVRSLVGIGTTMGMVPMPAHHLIGSGTDFLIAVFVLGAIYRAGDGIAA